MIPWREHSVTITVPYSELSVRLDEGLRKVKAQMRDCMVQHPLFVSYRRYRRGKNRCKYCGCKVEGAR